MGADFSSYVCAGDDAQKQEPARNVERFACVGDDACFGGCLEDSAAADWVFIPDGEECVYL